MCGIAAASLVEPVPWAPRVVDAMLAHQRHRGPDYTGSRASPDGCVLLGHNRLSIVDLSPAGNQPLSDEGGQRWAVVNGEIYNAPALRRELERKGHRFRSTSDSEVVVHLHEEHGSDLVHRLHGMFALVIADEASGTLLLARDRLGKKPLLYAPTTRGIAVASEIPALREFPGVDLSYDADGLGLYLLRNVRHIPDPYTIHRGIRRLPPGHAMEIARGRIKRLWRYWNPDFGVRDVSPAEVLETFDAAVSRRLLADTEIAAMLSGGVDSTAIVDAMGRFGAREIRTYALGRDSEDSELVRARRAATMLGTRHSEHHFDATEHHELLLDLWALHGEPIALPNLAYTYALCQAMRDDGIKVAMAGHGADEIFYGYTGFLQHARLSHLLRRLPMARGLPRGLAALAPPGSILREALLVSTAKPGRRKAALYSDEAARVWPDLLVRGDHLPHPKQVVDAWLSTWMSHPPEAYIDESAVIGLFHENTHSVTTAGDLPAMAASVEVRCPFLDHELVELAWAIPYDRKVQGAGDGSGLKAILKESLGARLPSDILYASKQGFGFNLQEADLFRGPWRSRLDAALDDMGDLDGLLRGDGVTALRHRFAETPDRRTAAAVSKLYALAVTTTGRDRRPGA